MLSGGAIALGFGCFWLILSGPLDELDAAESKHWRLKDVYLERYRTRVNLGQLREQLEAVKQMRGAARIVLPDSEGGEVARKALEDSIRAAAAEKHVSPPEISVGDSVSKEFYAHRPFSVRVSGEFGNVVEFLQRVSTGSRELRTIERMSLEPRPQGEGVVLALQAHAFAYLTDEQARSIRKARAAGAAPKQP